MSTPDFATIESQLTGPGSPFELTTEEVLGEKMRVFKQRKRSLREVLADSEAYGDRDYIVHNDRRISFAEHIRLVASTARALQELHGIEKGDRVAIFAENRPEWIVAYWAVVSLGAIATPLNGWWTPDEALYAIEITEPKLIIGDQKRLARLEGSTHGVPVLEIESQAHTLLEHAPDAALPDVEIDEDDPCTILFTSGTTGRPKCALNTHRGVIGFTQTTAANGARAVMAGMQMGIAREENPPEQCSLMTVPLFHLSGLYAGAVLMLSLGGKTVWRSGRFDPEDVLRLIEKERVTSWAGIGSMAHRVLNHPKIDDYDLSSIRTLGSGGAPTSPTILARMSEISKAGSAGRGLGYGSSETVATLTSISGLELDVHPTSAGRRTISVEVEIRDEQGNALPDGEEGEIFGRSAYLMREYFRNAEATEKTLAPGRWLATGDVGRIEDGYLFINSRARDMILRSGENIYPVEIEHRIEAHPDVAEAAVIGVDHPELGQEVKAIVVPQAGASVDAATLEAFCREKLASFKVPAHWDIREEPLPRNATGKVLKNVLSGEAENTFVEE